MGHDLTTGDRFTANLSVNRGLASVKIGRETISVGPVTCEDGQPAQLKYLGERETPIGPTQYAACLSKDLIDRSKYSEYLRQIEDLLVTDSPPERHEEVYLRVVDFDEHGNAIAVAGDHQINLGPIDVETDEIVEVVGVSNSAARVKDEAIYADNYRLRFALLTNQYDEIAIDRGEEYTSAVSEFDDGTPVCYIKSVPVHVQSCEAELGQKIDVEIVEFEDQTVVGDIVTLHDEYGAVNNPGHWARMQWLEQHGYADPTFRTFASEFVGVATEALPEKTARIREAVMGEALRYCINDKAIESEKKFPRAHITGIRHWVEHKLAPVLGAPGEQSEDDESEDTDWIQATLKDGEGPTITFHGDIVELSEGYYAPTTTRAIMINDTQAVLVSAVPTSQFVEQGHDVRLRGVSRVLVNTSSDELESSDIKIQSREKYINRSTDKYDKEFFWGFIADQDAEDWQPSEEWLAYTNSAGYGFDWGDNPIEVSDGTQTVSLWQEPIEYDSDQYYLRVNTEDETKAVSVPRQHRRQFCLLIDALSGRSREVELSDLPEEEAVRFACPFSPTREQLRWLNAVGAKWRGYGNDEIMWKIDRQAVGSVVQMLERLPINVRMININ